MSASMNLYVCQIKLRIYCIESSVGLAFYLMINKREALLGGDVIIAPHGGWDSPHANCDLLWLY